MSKLIPLHLDRLRRRHVHLTISNAAGSVEHYYHFTLGFLVPLLVSLDESLEVATARRLYVRSCAVFDSLLKETGLPLTILTRDRHKRLGRLLKKLPRWLPLTCIKLHGFDTPSKYDARRFKLAFEILQERLRDQIDGEARAIAQSWRGDGPYVLLIDRKEPLPYYLSHRAEGHGSGRSRRSIANIGELEDGLCAAGFNLRSESLEEKSLTHQIALFRGAEIVIAQHGAALTNMVWARPTTAFVEILPQGADILYRQDHFSELARSLGLAYESIAQPGKHGAVDASLVIRAVRQLVGPTKLEHDGKSQLRDDRAKHPKV